MPRLVARLGAHNVGALGLSCCGIGLAGVALFETDTSYLQLVVTMCVMAAGMSLTRTPTTTQLMAAVPGTRAGMGSATNDTTRELGGALGVAVLGSLLASQYQSGVASAVAGFLEQAREAAEGGIGGVTQAGELVDVATSRFVDGVTLAAAARSVIVLVAAVAVKRSLPSDRTNPAVTGSPEAAPALGE